jgi:hypothetical protein
MKRYRHEVQLINPTKRKWSLFKSIDRKIVNLVKKHGITIIKTFYRDDLFIKIVIFDDINDGKNRDVILFKAGNLLGRHNIELNIINMLEVFTTINKVKFKIGIVNPTTKNWNLFKSMELHIRKHAKKENVIRDDVKYNDKNRTLSLVASYPNELARSNLENIITLCYKGVGLERKIIEATKFTDFSDDIIDLSLYNANKLMDKAKHSLEKLSNM